MRLKQLYDNLEHYDEGDPKQLRKAMLSIRKMVARVDFKYNAILPLDIALGTALSIETGIPQLTSTKLNFQNNLSNLKILVVDTFIHDSLVVDTVTQVLTGRGAQILVACLSSVLSGVNAVFNVKPPAIDSNSTGVFETWIKM